MLRSVCFTSIISYWTIYQNGICACNNYYITYETKFTCEPCIRIRLCLVLGRLSIFCIFSIHKLMQVDKVLEECRFLLVSSATNIISDISVFPTIRNLPHSTCEYLFVVVSFACWSVVFHFVQVTK